jgi:gas vesicle protein
MLLSVFLFPVLLFAQSKSKYEAIILPDDAPAASIRDPKVINQMKSNCSVISTETMWNSDLHTFNNDQCALYSGYTDFSTEQLNWIDEVKLITVQDKTTGMEVEEVQFYQDGKEVPASDFLSSRLDACKGTDKAKTASSCAAHFAELTLKLKPMMTSAKNLSTKSDDMVKGTSSQLKQDIDGLKSSRNPADVKKAKELKKNLESVESTGEMSSVMLPGLAKLMAEDYRKIDGISRTLKKLEKGL